MNNKIYEKKKIIIFLQFVVRSRRCTLQLVVGQSLAVTNDDAWGYQTNINFLLHKKN